MPVWKRIIRRKPSGKCEGKIMPIWKIIKKKTLRKVWRKIYCA